MKGGNLCCICYPFSEKKFRELPIALFFYILTLTFPAPKPEAYEVLVDGLNQQQSVFFFPKWLATKIKPSSSLKCDSYLRAHNLWLAGGSTD